MINISEKCLNEIIFANENLKYWLKKFGIKRKSDIVKLYSSVGSKWLNDYLKKTKYECNCKNLIAEMINLQLTKQKKYSNKTVFRMEDNFEGNFLKWNNNTNIIELPYFLSTSKDNWDNKKYVIEIKTSLKSESVDLLNFGIISTEKEILFPLKSKFEIKSISGNLIKLNEVN